MTKREITLIKILVIIAFLVSVYFISFSYKTKKIELIQSIEKYEQQISKHKKSKKETEEEVEFVEVSEFTLAQVTDLVLSDLKKFNIIPERYQLYENTKEPYVEFIINSNTYDFICYLNSLNNENEILPYTINFCSMKPNDNTLKTTVRYNQKSCKTLPSQFAYSINEIYSMFRRPPKKEQKVEIVEETKPSEEKIEYEKNKYKLVGIINENGEKYLYIKDTFISKLHKIPLNKIQKEDNESFYIFINDKMTKIDK